MTCPRWYVCSTRSFSDLVRQAPPCPSTPFHALPRPSTPFHALPHPSAPFHTLPRPLLQVLITTANFPDVMLGVYKQSRLTFLFFASFLLVGLFFLMNMFLAEICTT